MAFLARLSRVAGAGLLSSQQLGVACRAMSTATVNGVPVEVGWEVVSHWLGAPG